MPKQIVYKQENGKLAVVYPATNCGLSVEEIARKDVPAGIKYKIIDESVVPETVEYFEAWEADFTEYDGIGIGQEAWFAEQAAKE